jgi:hypothetical protein
MSEIFLVGMPEIHQGFITDSILGLPDIIVENNFEQAFGSIKLGEIKRVCILMDVWNISGYKYNNARGQGAAERIHSVDPVIPILIWEGREYDCPDDMPAVFQVYGEVHPIKFDNELYLNFSDFKGEEQRAITRKFLSGKLTKEEIPKGECISFRFQVS